ncbi:hypothetical protein A8139_20910 [Marinomonas primoryensis]|uniref:Oligosaccharide repeat unit polymerase n=1 Tax=Marinomonas primoryensis TaxID=178399 RepID=A0A2Z4PWX3_9GAMM|nr:oligosaccharide repeat unit polymerase [Marinomonas primoryensis]AWY01067.1 hypothetical protein A8139_14565 [Marinomonas primoryensis]AWY02122.1 hypothetical protein A8139_20910 [Marinomonas primoryensis]
MFSRQGKVNTLVFKRFFSVGLYAVLFHYGYVEFSFHTFEYAGYKYFDGSFFEYVTTYFFALLPSLFIRSYKRISYFGIVLIYIVIYVPAQLTIQFNLAEKLSDKFMLQFCLCLSFMIIFTLSKVNSVNLHQRDKKIDDNFVYLIFVFNLIVIMFLIYKYHGHMRLVGFEDVYDLRFDTNSIKIPLLVSYFQMWMTYLFIPLFVAIGIQKKNYAYIFFAFSISILIYLIQGSKLAILMLLTVYALLYAYDRKGDFLINLSLCISAFIVFIFLIPNFGVIFWIKSLLFVRTLGTPGWMIVHYYEYFTENGYSYYGHINIINYIFSNYPYGDLALGQLIGLEYSGTIDANFNANFWASDGIAALGLPGLFLISIVLGAFFRILDNVSNGFDLRITFISMIGFWQALLNIPLMTALLSGGGILLVFILFSERFSLKINK